MSLSCYALQHCGIDNNGQFQIKILENFPDGEEQLEQQDQKRGHLSTEKGKEDSRKSLYNKIFPHVNSFKNKVYPSKLFSADHVKINENGPIIGDLDKYHTVNIYSNTYKETTKR